MDINIKYWRKNPRTWIVEIWLADGNTDGDYGEQLLSFTPPETALVEINQWCIDTFGYHARTAYNRFELRKKSNLDWFLLRWL